MRKAQITENTLVRLHGTPYRICHRTKLGAWTLIDRETHEVKTYPERQLYDFYAFGALRFEKSDQDTLPSTEPGQTLQSYGTKIPPALEDHSEQEQKRIIFWHTLIIEVEKRVPYGHGRTPIEANGIKTCRLDLALAEISHELGRDRPVSRSRYYYWKAQLEITGDTSALKGRYSDRGRKPNRELRRIIKAELRRAMTEANALANHPANEKQGKKPGYSIKAVRTAVDQILKGLRQTIPDLNWKLPSISTFYEIEEEFPEWDRQVARLGKNTARKNFRAIYGREPCEGIHEETEYDETIIPMFFFDDVFGVPLGRATLTWYIDVFTDMPDGFYVGFEPPSDLTLVSALRHACVPKTYVNQAYPDIKRPYLPCGIPNLLTFDNQLAQHSKTIRLVAANLQTTYRFAAPRTPWFKASVEAMFEVLNRCLLSELPGFVLSRDIDRKDYDPSVMGCIGLFHFLYIFHKWLVDVYCQTPQGLHRRSPEQRWLDGAERWAPDMLASVDDYDNIFGLLREGRRFDHRGVVFENIWYYSEDMDLFRRLRGDHGVCRVKIPNPNDLSSVLVWEPREKAWLRVWANRSYAKYAAGLSLHRHKLNVKYMRENLGTDDADALMTAQHELQKLISNALQDAMSIRQSVKLARAIGIGTQNIFDNVDQTGQLQQLTGPFAGRQLNPFAKPETPENVLQDPQDQARPAGQNGKESNVVRLSDHQRPAIEFTTDDSLKDF